MNKPKRNSNSTKITISLSKKYMDYFKELNKLLNEKTKKEWTLSQTIRLVLEERTYMDPELVTNWIKDELKNNTIK